MAKTKSLELRIEKLEQVAVGNEGELLSFDIRFVDAITKVEMGRLTLNEDGTRTHYEPGGDGGWRSTDEQA